MPSRHCQKCGLDLINDRADCPRCGRGVWVNRSWRAEVLVVALLALALLVMAIMAGRL